MVIRIVAWEKDESGAESILDILEIEGEPFTARGNLKGFHSGKLRKLLMDDRVSRVQLERVKAL